MNGQLHADVAVDLAHVGEPGYDDYLHHLAARGIEYRTANEWGLDHTERKRVVYREVSWSFHKREGEPGAWKRLTVDATYEPRKESPDAQEVVVSIDRSAGGGLTVDARTAAYRARLAARAN